MGVSKARIDAAVQRDGRSSESGCRKSAKQSSGNERLLHEIFSSSLNVCIANYSFKGFWSHPKCMMQKYFPDVHTGKPFMIYVRQKFFIYFQSPRQRYNYFSYFFNSPFSVAFMQQTGKKQLQKSFPENKKQYPRVSYKVKQYRVLTCPKIWEQVFIYLLL